MSKDPKYEKCRSGHHVASVTRTHVEGDSLDVFATCRLCGAELEAYICVSDMDATWPSSACCTTCGEAPLYCECDR